jgi:hypothetical protein
VNWAEESAARLAAERAVKMELQWAALTVVEKADTKVELRVARTAANLDLLGVEKMVV